MAQHAESIISIGKNVKRRRRRKNHNKIESLKILHERNFIGRLTRPDMLSRTRFHGHKEDCLLALVVAMTSARRPLHFGHSLLKVKEISRRGEKKFFEVIIQIFADGKLGATTK